eukprot:SAG22_NODE_1467_length_4349_cov_3.654353_4_plen_66_part_00
MPLSLCTVTCEQAAAFPTLAFFAANIVQAFQPGATAAEVGKQIGKSFGSFFLGLIGIAMLAMSIW